MTRIAVTGGSGKLGRAVVEDLRRHGDEVVVLDRRLAASELETGVELDLADYGQVLGAFTGVDDRHSGFDAVVHLAAIPAPGRAPNAAIFANNVLATYHVFEAARVVGIHKVVFASSETTLGLPLDVPPPYLPIDEEYRVRPESAYSLGKAVDEEIAHHFSRWQPAATIIGLRFSNVMAVEDYADFPTWQDDAAIRRWNAWGYIDARDGAQAVRLALHSDITGFEVFIIANADTVLLRDSAMAAAQEFPDVPFRRQVTGTETLLSIEKARRMLGYEPEHSWRDHAGGASE